MSEQDVAILDGCFYDDISLSEGVGRVKISTPYLWYVPWITMDGKHVDRGVSLSRPVLARGIKERFGTFNDLDDYLYIFSTIISW